MVKIYEKDDTVFIHVYVQPRASRTEVVGPHGDALKIRLAAPPVDGAANEELIRFLAKLLGTSVSRVSVVSGESSRQKVVAVEGVDRAAVESALTVEK